MSDPRELKLECIRLANGDVRRAQEIYEWVTKPAPDKPPVSGVEKVFTPVPGSAGGHKPRLDYGTCQSTQPSADFNIFSAQPLAPEKAEVEVPEGFLRSYNGTCEVPSGTDVEYVYEDGVRGYGVAQNGWIGHPVRTKTSPADLLIIAYRVIAPQPLTPTPLKGEGSDALFVPQPEPVATGVRNQVEQDAGEADIPEGFTKWDGGECPVGAETIVEVILRDGATTLHGNLANPAYRIDWTHLGNDLDIIAYRILPQQPDTQTGSQEGGEEEAQGDDGFLFHTREALRVFEDDFPHMVRWYGGEAPFSKDEPAKGTVLHRRGSKSTSDFIGNTAGWKHDPIMPGLNIIAYALDAAAERLVTHHSECSTSFSLDAKCNCEVSAPAGFVRSNSDECPVDPNSTVILWLGPDQDIMSIKADDVNWAHQSWLWKPSENAPDWKMDGNRLGRDAREAPTTDNAKAPTDQLRTTESEALSGDDRTEQTKDGYAPVVDPEETPEPVTKPEADYFARVIAPQIEAEKKDKPGFRLFGGIAGFGGKKEVVS